MQDYAVKIDHVSMQFNLAKEKTDSLKEHIIKRIKGELHYNLFTALDDVSLEVEKGASFAIIGSNGSGKSTLLKLISGIYRPTKGVVHTIGSIAPLIELGSGFDGDLTARENIFLNGALLGYNHSEMSARFQTIMDFAELWNFVDVPVKNYSSGMTARLGFAIATIVKPEILIVDEILSVGDAAFQKKCEDKMQQLLSGGTTMLLVSHSKEQILSLCTQGAWLDHGKVRAIGDIRSVYECYENSYL